MKNEEQHSDVLLLAFCICIFRTDRIDKNLVMLLITPCTSAICIVRNPCFNGSYFFALIRFLCFDKACEYSFYKKSTVHRPVFVGISRTAATTKKSDKFKELTF